MKTCTCLHACFSRWCGITGENTRGKFEIFHPLPKPDRDVMSAEPEGTADGAETRWLVFTCSPDSWCKEHHGRGCKGWGQARTERAICLGHGTFRAKTGTEE